MPQRGCDRRDWHAGGDGRDPEAVPETFRAGLGALNVGIGYDPGDFPVGGRPQPGLERPAGGLRWRRAEHVDELENAEQLRRNGDLAPALSASLQGPVLERDGFEVDVPGTNSQGFGNPGAGVSERRRTGDRGPSETCRSA